MNKTRNCTNLKEANKNTINHQIQYQSWTTFTLAWPREANVKLSHTKVAAEKQASFNNLRMAQ